MIKVVIIEDELLAVKKLRRFLEQLNEPIKVLAELHSVEEAINFFKVDNEVDLVFSDIELMDGNAFEIYKEVMPHCPIIFATAYNQFLMDAFETNGIAYLLKPFSFDRFEKAWQKFKSLYLSKPQLNHTMMEKLSMLLGEQPSARNYRARFAVNTGGKTYFLAIADIVFFNAEEGVVFAIDRQGKNHLLSQATLKQVEEEVDPKLFFRINRAQLVHKVYVEETERYNKNALAIKLKTHHQFLITSQSSTAAFKDWIEN